MKKFSILLGLLLLVSCGESSQENTSSGISDVVDIAITPDQVQFTGTIDSTSIITDDNREQGVSGITVSEGMNPDVDSESF